MVALRLGNPKHSHLFDRVPRRTLSNEVTTQSSTEKFKKFSFRKLGDIMIGDLVQLKENHGIVRETYDEKVPCRIFFHVQGFYIQGDEYKAEGKCFFHSSLPELRYLRDWVGNNNCFIQIRNMVEDLKFELTLRSRNEHPTYSNFVYDERTP